MIKIGLPKGVLKSKSKMMAKEICKCELFDSQLKVSNEKYMFLFLKHRDIPKCINLGILDYGITSDEWIIENGKDKFNEIMEINWCKTKMALIMKDSNQPIKVCATEFPNIAKNYFRNNDVKILYISGSSETLIPEIVDASIDCVETGKTLRDNQLIIKDTIFDSNIKLISKKDVSSNNIDEIIEYLKEYKL